MILLEVAQLTKHFGPEPVLDGVSFEIRPGQRIGLVGPNGAGKTTLLSILAGKLEADSGRCELHPSARLAYLEQQPTLAPGRTLWDEALSALDDLLALAREAEEVSHALSAALDPADHRRLGERYERLEHEMRRRDAYTIDHRVERVLEGLGFSRDSFRQPIEQLSGGQHNRLMLAKLLLTEPDVMLMDEPSNHLDIEATEWLERFLSESRQAMLVVSHDRYFLDKVTNRTLELFHGTVDDYAGNFSAYWRQKALRVEVQTRTYEKQQEMIAKTEDFIRRNHYGQKHTQAEDRKKKLARVERVEPPRQIAGPVMGFPPADRTGDIVLRGEHLAKSFDRPLFAELTFEIARGERWGILGPNGSGKTTLLRCVVGQERLDAGQVILGTGVRIGYYDQLLGGLDEGEPVVEAIRPPRKEFNEPQRRALLARFGITGDAAFQRVGSLSGGERSRAALAQLAATDANFLLLDEPTNHLDLWACDALERSLQEFDGTVLMVSHDRYFLNRVADHLLVVEPGRFRVIEGNYDTYLHFVARGLAGGGADDGATPDKNGKPSRSDALNRDDTPNRGNDNSSANKASTTSSAHTASTTSSASTTSFPRRRESRKPRPKRRFPYRKVADLEQEIFERETRLAEAQAELLLPEVLRDGRKVREVQERITAEQAALTTLYEHWEEATELN